jgi:MFS family permease
MEDISRQAPAPAFWRNRWVQLIIGILCMALVANLQYAWTLFVAPMNARHHWGQASIQLAFSIFILTETWLVPLEGYFVDRFGPRPVVAVGALCAGLAWVMNSFATTLPELYIASVIAGIGAGGVYGTFPGSSWSRRGSDGSGLRRGRSRDGDSNREHDHGAGLRAHVPVLRHPAGRGDLHSLDAAEEARSA